MDSMILTLLEQIIPSEILKDFDISSVDTSKSDEIIISLTEKMVNVPSQEEDLVLNGYLNEIELTHFPLNGKQCFLKLKRRRWKKRGDVTGKESYFNTYSYAVDGTRITQSFGSFLKEIGRENSF